MNFEERDVYVRKDYEKRQRLGNILDMIGRIAALDFSVQLDISEKNDMIDAISLGLNMLSEELNSNVVEKVKLDAVKNKLEKFAYTTAHDLKSPLNSIIGLVALLETGLKLDKKSDNYFYLLKLKEITEQMRRLISEILDYSKIPCTEIKKERIDLNKIFSEIIDLDRIALSAEVRIINQLPCVLFNKILIIQIIRNLLSNAIKHCDKEICRIEIEAWEMNDHYKVCVSDNGPGIALEDHEKIFELFRTIDSKDALKDSHGIGLATVKNVLESQGEKIWVESLQGRGAKFIFTIKKEPSITHIPDFPE